MLGKVSMYGVDVMQFWGCGVSLDYGLKIWVAVGSTDKNCEQPHERRISKASYM